MDTKKTMDYSKLDPIELNAISTAFQNVEGRKNGIFLSSFPYFTESLEVLGEEFLHFPSESINGLKMIHDEIITINRHLLEMTPAAPSKNVEEIIDKMSHDELVDNFLKQGLIVSLVEAFSSIQKNVALRITMLEKEACFMEGGNGQIN